MAQKAKTSAKSTVNPLLKKMLGPASASAQFDVAAAFKAASHLYSTGKFSEAGTAFRAILAREPQQADSLFLLGQLRQKQGDLEEAESLFRRAVAAREDWRFLFSLAVLLHELRRHPEAEAVYRRTLDVAPNMAMVHNNYGNLLAEIGRFEDAETAYRNAIAGSATFSLAFNNLGNVLKAMRRHGEAEEAYRRALGLDLAHLPARLSLALLLAQSGQAVAAEKLYRETIALHPSSHEAQNNLGVLLQQQGRDAEAEQAFRQALELQAAFPQAANNIGNVLRKAGRHGDAIIQYQRAITLAPNYAEAHNNLGTALKEDGQHAAALASYRRALALAPRNPDTHLNLACMLLAEGDFANGWQEYEYRWYAAGRAGPPAFAAPQWDGKADLHGKTLFLHAEQGFGDTLQFLRYATLAAERGATVLLGVPPELKRLAASCPGVAQVLTTGDATPVFDLHCPLMSLPLAFGTEVETIPAQVPYLHADADAVAAWDARLGSKTAARIGLVWAGKPRKENPESHAVDKLRSMELAQLQPLLDVPGTSFTSLQLGEAAGQAKGNAKLTDFTGDLHDFHDTAALVANLDLVISVDTAVAHLAGALGKPVWMLDRHQPCWRWLRERTDSPWYPALRIFRQPQAGDWHSVVEAACNALAQFTAARQGDG